VGDRLTGGRLRFYSRYALQDPPSRSLSQKDAVRRNAEKHFAGPEQRNSSVTQLASAACAASDANTARLRALRLEKEETERQAAIAAGTSPAFSPTRKPTAP
jgi:hypothetical protein